MSGCGAHLFDRAQFIIGYNASVTTKYPPKACLPLPGRPFLTPEF